MLHNFCSEFIHHAHVLLSKKPMEETTMITQIGWIGAIAFGVCGLPQAWKSYKDGHADGISNGFLALWTIGEVFTTIAVVVEAPKPYLLANYALNAVFLAVMWKYKIWRRYG